MGGRRRKTRGGQGEERGAARGGKCGEAAGIPQLWGIAGRGVPTTRSNEVRAPSPAPTQPAPTRPGQTRPDLTGLAALGTPLPPSRGVPWVEPGGKGARRGRSHDGSGRRAGREDEEEVEQQKKEEVEQEEEDICSLPWRLCITCSSLFTAVALAAFGRTSPQLASRPLSLTSHPHAPAGDAQRPLGTAPTLDPPPWVPL